MNPTGKIFAAAVLAAVSRVGRERSDDVACSHADSCDLSCVDESIDAAFKASACYGFLLGVYLDAPKTNQNPNFSLHLHHIETLNIVNNSCMEY